MLDPVTERGPIQARNHDRVDELPCTERGAAAQSHSFAAFAQWNVLESDRHSEGIRPAHSWGVTLCDASTLIGKAT